MLLAGSALVLPTMAQPGGKVIHIVVPFAAGGAREVLARTFHGELAQALGQPVIVENRPGAGGAIGTASVAKAAPDGTTPAYDPIKGFAPVANIGMQSYVLMTTAELPAKRVAELVEYARKNPGKLNYASPGHGSSGHLAMAYFCKLAGIDMVHIPYKSTQDATNDLLAGRSHATIVPNVGAMPVQKDTRIPDVPAVAEDLPGYAFESWFGLLAPAKTPRPVIERINTGVGKLRRNPVILERLAAQGVEPRPLSVPQFEELVRDDYAAMAKVAQAVGKVE